MKGRRTAVINMYHCKNCNVKFLTPMKITRGKHHTEFVCPECKSRDWGHLW